ncbi:serum amyloid P-component-like isoform X2 [Sphaerodactylus townsendi]|uniref:serum amyloid P-component-like isoform X2 n=1 Tax=Sphaerodactylus townsendi TaxID=933632 RepID=UPI002026F59E|nr:serum amyloid P-component-like isoform X2 [Sphaerodactylus townsendi]
MAILHALLAILVGSLGTLASQGLERKIFIFPEASNTAPAVLRTALQQPLTSFTVCLRSYTDLNRAYSLFSYTSGKSDNEFTIFKPKPDQYSLFVGGSIVTFSVVDYLNSKPHWENICMSWESATGIVQGWVNSQGMPRKGMKQGYTISSDASIILGQQQNSFGDGFDINQSFVGEITDVYLWGRVLSQEEMDLFRNRKPPSDYLIDWQPLNYEINDYVVVKPLFSSNM